MDIQKSSKPIIIIILVVVGIVLIVVGVLYWQSQATKIVVYQPTSVSPIAPSPTPTLNSSVCEKNFSPDCCFRPDKNFTGFTTAVDASKIVNDSSLKIISNQILIIFKKGTSEENIKAKISEIDGEIIGCMIDTNMFQVEIKNNPTLSGLKSLINKLNKDLDIKSVSENIIYRPEQLMK